MRFATERDASTLRAPEICRYSLPVHTYPGQEALAPAKRHNLELMAAALDRVTIGPGETFSLWRLVADPTVERGYRPAAAIIGGVLTTDVGGSTCLLSTVIYNAALLGGLAIEERHNHGVDTYGEDRYYELGRDATIEYPYLDLRFRNPYPWPVVFRAGVDGTVWAAFESARPLPFRIRLEVPPPTLNGDVMRVQTLRQRIDPDGLVVTDDLGLSVFRLAPERISSVEP